MVIDRAFHRISGVIEGVFGGVATDGHRACGAGIPITSTTTTAATATTATASATLALGGNGAFSARCRRLVAGLIDVRTDRCVGGSDSLC